MPANTVKVDRSTRWGNPHKVERADDNGAEQLGGRWYCLDGISWWASDDKNLVADYAALVFFDDLNDGRLDITVAEVRSELAGKNLACWCPPDAPCHADVLIEIANSPETS